MLVLAGTYANERIDVRDRQLMIASVGGPDVTTVEGTAAESIVTFEDGRERSFVRGFTFRSGRGSFDSAVGATRGGAMRIDTTPVTVENCVFEDCSADLGGALSVRRVTASAGLDRRLVIEDSTFRGSCTATLAGGAIHSDGFFVSAVDSAIEGHVSQGEGGAVHATEGSFQTEDCAVNGTAPGNGGAIYLRLGPPQLVRTSVTARCTSGGLGGGLYQEFGAFSSVSECRFTGCRAASGGAIYTQQSETFRVVDSWFEDNATEGGLVTDPAWGGAICALGSIVFVRDTVFVDNRALDDPRALGGALFGQIGVDRATFLDNDAALDGAAVYALPPLQGGTPPDLRFSILTRRPGSTTPLVNADARANRNLIEGGFAGGVGNSDEDPQLWSPRDPHLLPGSPAIAGDGLAQRGALPFDPHYCGEGCDGAIGLVSCVAQPHRLGYPATISGVGSLDVDVDRVVINVDDLPNLTTSYFIGGTSAAFVPGAGGGVGNLCLGGTVERFPLQPPTPSGAISSFRPVLAGFPSGRVVTAGETWFFQLWFRDAVASGPTSNLSPALYLRFE